MTTHATPSVKQTDSPLAIAAMVCGVLSLAGAGLLLGIPALILGIIALKRNDAGRGLSIAGIITGAISILLSLIMIAVMVWLLIWGGYDRVRQQQPPDATPAYDSSHI